MKPTGRVQHTLDSTGEAGRGSLDLEFKAIVGDECDIVRCRCHDCGIPVVYGRDAECVKIALQSSTDAEVHKSQVLCESVGAHLSFEWNLGKAKAKAMPRFRNLLASTSRTTAPSSRDYASS